MVERWQIQIQAGPEKRVVAEVYDNGLWHTFDRSGTGGANWREADIVSAILSAFHAAVQQEFFEPNMIVELGGPGLDQRRAEV